MSVIEPRISTYYKSVLCPDLIYTRKVENIMELPKIVQCVLNSSSGNTLKDTARGLATQIAMQTITSQKARATRSRKSIASFQLRKGHYLGCTTNLRGAALDIFLDQYIYLVSPKIVEQTPWLVRTAGDFNFAGDNFTHFPGLEGHFLALSTVGGYNCTLCASCRGEKDLGWLLTALQFPAN